MDRKPVSIWCDHHLPQAARLSPSHRVDQAVDCGQWIVVPLLFNGCAKLLDIGGNYPTSTMGDSIHISKPLNHTTTYTLTSLKPGFIHEEHTSPTCQWPSKEKSKAGTQHTYEARGPGGCMLLIDMLTDNNTRSHQDLKHLLSKHGAALCDGVRHNFSRKGVVVAQGQGVSSERALELAIEAGAEDVQETEDEDDKSLLQFVCDMTELKKVRTSLEELGVRTVSAGLEFVSHTPTQLPQAQLEAALSLIEALSDCLDVVRVWDNIKAHD
ncbi:translational activator of cytochrome c oxidase 1 isoform X3 [Oncorhynchus keta]|uniref:translational activator of cytochrome c oxidase 1 isoform X3 n=1 Tax=Oncorhynchus keta TaxID=8018 RepID=UPI0015FA50A7|nr:translational activator of cytochrome c oxidase 1 isoform X3 [Oncorhynchus keta]